MGWWLALIILCAGLFFHFPIGTIVCGLLIFLLCWIQQGYFAISSVAPPTAGNTSSIATKEQTSPAREGAKRGFTFMPNQPLESTKSVASALDTAYAPPPPPAAQTPVADVSTTQQRFFVYVVDAVKGPFSIEQIKALLSVATVSLDTQVCKEGTEDWFSLRQLYEA